MINSCTLVALSLWYVADKLDWSPSFRFARKDSKPKSSPPKSKQENSDNQEKPLEETAEDDEHPGGITAFADSSKGIAASLPWIPDYRRNPPVSAGTEKTEGQHLSTLEEFSLNARTYLERSKSDIVIPMVPQSSHSSVNDGWCWMSDRGVAVLSSLIFLLSSSISDMRVSIIMSYAHENTINRWKFGSSLESHSYFGEPESASCFFHCHQ